MAIAHEIRAELARGLAAVKIRIPLLAVLVMLTLLVCHGALGSTDRLALEPAAVAHQSSGAAGASVNHLVEHASAHTYYYVAALCTLLLGSFVGLFFGDVSRRRRFAVLRGARQRFSLKLSFGGVRSTPPFLQVFRL